MQQLFEWLNSLFPLIEKGGWVMWPIVLCSMVALAIFFERLWFLVIRGSRIVPKGLLTQVAGLLDKGRIEDAVILCRKNDSAMSRVVLAGLSMYGAPRATVREMMEDAGRRESRELDRFLGVLAAVAGVSPLLGLFGTVIGMIEIFQEIAAKNIGQYEALAGGIYVALYTTAAGLMVAIPAYLAYRGLAGMADNYIKEMEDWAVDLLNRLDRAGARENGQAVNGAAEAAQDAIS